MENVIENLNRLDYLDEGQKKSIEVKAQAHKRYSNITFQVVKVNKDELIVQVKQLNHLSKNYADVAGLVKVAEDTFSTMLYGRKLKVGAKPFIPAPADVVNAEWVRDKMAKQGLKAVDLEVYLGNDKFTLSKLITGKKEMTRAIKSMFYYFFLSNELKQKLEQYETV